MVFRAPSGNPLLYYLTDCSPRDGVYTSQGGLQRALLSPRWATAEAGLLTQAWRSWMLTI